LLIYLINILGFQTFSYYLNNLIVFILKVSLSLQVVTLPLNPFLVLDQPVIVRLKLRVLLLDLPQVRNPIAEDVLAVLGIRRTQNGGHRVEVDPPGGEVVFRGATFFGGYFPISGFKVVPPRSKVIFGGKTFCSFVFSVSEPSDSFGLGRIGQIVAPRCKYHLLRKK